MTDVTADFAEVVNVLADQMQGGAGVGTIELPTLPTGAIDPWTSAQWRKLAPTLADALTQRFGQRVYTGEQISDDDGMPFLWFSTEETKYASEAV